MRANSITLTCPRCANSFKRPPSDIAAGAGKFCSVACYRASQGSPRERLLKHRQVDPATGCWLWTRSLDTYGYGHMKIGGKLYTVPRVAASEFLDFDLTSPLRVLHRCDTPRCFNPDHLFFGTQADNIADMDAKGRRGTTKHRSA